MDGHVPAAGTAAAQDARSQPRDVSVSTKKISFSFGGVTSSRGSSSFGASTSTAVSSSTPSGRFSTFTVASGSGRSSRLTATSCTAAAPPKQVPSIFCSNDEGGCDSRARATEQVLSFDKYSGWEKKATDDAPVKKPLVIPCLHPLKPSPRAAFKGDQAQRTSAAEGRRAAASTVTRMGTDETATEAAVGAPQEARVSAGDPAGALGRKQAAAAAATAVGREPVAGERGTGADTNRSAPAGERAQAEGGPCEEAEQQKGEKEKREISGSQPAAPCGAVPYVSGAAVRKQGGTAAAMSEHNSGGQTDVQQSQEERKEGSLQYGLVKRGPAIRTVDTRSNALAVGGKERDTPTSSASKLTCRVTPGLSPHLSASPEAAAADCLADDADELAAQALIAEAKGEDSAASDAVPILARNAELAALRRKFRQRMQWQQQLQTQQQQQSQQAQEELQYGSHVQRRQPRGRGHALYETTDIFPGSSDFLSRTQGDRNMLGRAEADAKKYRSCTDTTRSDGDTSREDAAAEAGGHSGAAAGASASSAVSGTAAASHPAAVGARGRNDALVNGSVFGESRYSQTQQGILSREEAEKELLRQELDLLPDAPQAHSAAYAVVPVSEFGIAMLRGMGYDPAVAAAKAAAADEEEKKSIKKRVYTRAGLGSETEVERLWTEREKKLKEEAMKEKRRKLEEMQNSRYHR